jgi:hypothetical protein
MRATRRTFLVVLASLPMSVAVAPMATAHATATACSRILGNVIVGAQTPATGSSGKIVAP